MFNIYYVRSLAGIIITVIDLNVKAILLWLAPERQAAFNLCDNCATSVTDALYS